MARRFARFERVEAILPKMVKGMSIGPEFKARMVLFYWGRIVGQDIARHVHPVKVEYHTLYLSAENPSWANQLMLMRLEIIDKVNHFMGERIINEIRFGVSAKERAQSHPKPDPEAELLRSVRRQVLAPDKEIAATELCQAVTDDELRQRLTHMYQTQLRSAQAKKKLSWHPCSICGVLCPPEEQWCTACSRAQRQRTAARIQEILAAMPWARYGDIYAVVKCTPDMVNYQRMLLLQRLVSRVSPGDHTSLDARMLVMLYRSLPPEQLTEKVMEQALDQLRYDIDPTLFRREYKQRTGSAGQEYGKKYQQNYQKNHFGRKGKLSKR